MESGTIRKLSKVQKFALLIALLWLLFCVLGALIESWYILLLICIALLAAIICLFRGTLDAKYAWVTFAVSLILPFIMIGVLTDSEERDTKDDTEKAEMQKTVSTEKEAKQKETKKVEEKQESKMSPKEQEVANAGYKKGTMFGMAGASNEEFSNMLDLADYVDGMEEQLNEILEQSAGQQYDLDYSAPTNAEEKKLKKIYIEQFIKGFEETMDAMDNLEKLGGKRK